MLASVIADIFIIFSLMNLLWLPYSFLLLRLPVHVHGQEEVNRHTAKYIEIVFLLYQNRKSRVSAVVYTLFFILFYIMYI